MISRFVAAIRRNAVAWLALFVALTGTSLAASHYIITSTKQIKPSVLSKLHGAAGPKGSTGPQGAAGKEGAAGLKGEKGERGEKGEKSEKGEKGEKGLKGEKGEKGEAGGPEGPQGKEGKEGKEGLAGKEGKEGKEGAKGEQGPLAYAHINAAGTKIEDARNFEGAKVTFGENTKHEKEPGVYCIAGLSFTPKNAVANIDAEESGELPVAITVHVGSTKFCPSAQLSVETYEDSLEEVGAGKYLPATETVDDPFYIEVN